MDVEAFSAAYRAACPAYMVGEPCTPIVVTPYCRDHGVIQSLSATDPSYGGESIPYVHSYASSVRITLFDGFPSRSRSVAVENP